MVEKDSAILGSEKIGTLLLKFSGPAIIGTMINMLYLVIDRIYIGNAIGSVGIAAITICFPYFLFLMAFGMLLGGGAALLVSIRLGQKKKDEAELILGNAISLTVVITLLMTLIGFIFLDSIVRLMGAFGDAIPYVKIFFTIILIGSVFQTFSFGINNIIRAEGNPKISMLIMVIGAAVNVIFAPILIFIFKLGIAGSALATVLAQIVTTFLILIHFTGSKSILHLSKKNLFFNKKIITRIIQSGFPQFCIQMLSSVMNVLLNRQLAYYGGEDAVTAMGMIFSIVVFVVMPIMGITYGMQPIVGYNYGAGKNDRVIKALNSSIVWSSVISVFGFIIIQIFPEFFFSLFAKNSDSVLKAGIQGIHLYLLGLPILSFTYIGTSFFQSIERPNFAFLLSVIRQGVLFIPVVLILPYFLKLAGVWVAAPVADYGSFILTVILLFKETQILKLRQKVDMVNN